MTSASGASPLGCCLQHRHIKYQQTFQTTFHHSNPFEAFGSRHSCCKRSLSPLHMLLYLIAFILAYIMVTQIPSIEMLRRLRNAGFGQENQAPQSSRSNETSQSSSADDGYRPTPADICIVRLMITRAIKLPPDLVDAIFDHAEYWAHSSNEIDFELEHKSPLKIVGSSPVEDKFLVSHPD